MNDFVNLPMLQLTWAIPMLSHKQIRVKGLKRTFQKVQGLITLLEMMVFDK